MSMKADKRIVKVANPGEDPETLRAKVLLTPNLQAASTLQDWLLVDEPPTLTALTDELARQSKAIQDGDLSRAESMLSAQAHVLDAIFSRLAKSALVNMGEYMEAAEMYMKLALRAQRQSALTWETVSRIQNPPTTTFVKQANMAHNQQVNNRSARTQETEKPPNQLLEKTNGNRLDFGAQGTAGAVDTPVATVGEVDRTEDAGG